jgi:carboxypeptidase Q
MKSLIFASALIAVSAPAASQDDAQVVVDPNIAAMRDDALANDRYAWDITEGLTTEIGPRLAGTDAEARARDWAVRKLTAMGFANARIDKFPLTVWTRGSESAHILSPFPQPLAIAALGNSASTGPAGVTGELVAFNSTDELRAAPDSAVKGKIVFIDHRMAATQDGSSYGPGGEPRRNGPTLASKKGAIAVIVRSAGTDHHRNPHTGVMTFAEGVAPIPAGAVSVPDAEQIARIFKRGKQVRLHLVLVSQARQGESGNVIAELPGRDPSLPPILVSCHLDSWDQGTGAIDDASGCGIVAAAAKRIMDVGLPTRTIRIVWFGSEEVGLFGGIDYRNRYGKQPHYALMESDFGADRVYKVRSRLGDQRRSEAQMIGAALAPLGIVTGSFKETGGSDISVMLADGLPGVALDQDGLRYFDVHHTPDDTLDKVDPAQLRQNVAAWTAAVAVLAGPIEWKSEPNSDRRRY